MSPWRSAIRTQQHERFASDLRRLQAIHTRLQRMTSLRVTTSTHKRRSRASHSATVRSITSAGRWLNASLPHLGQRANQSPGPNASLRGATVFFQPHSSHTKVKGLGLIGIAALLNIYTWSFPSARSASGICLLDPLIKLSAIPTVLLRNTLYILGNLHDDFT